MKAKKAAVKKRTSSRDLGDRCHHAGVLEAVGKIAAREAIVNTRQVPSAFGARYRGATVVMETVRSLPGAALR